MSSILTLAGNNTSTGFYSKTIDQSLRFEDGDSAHLSRTPSSASNQRTFTTSHWLKRGNLGGTQPIFTAASGESAVYRITFGSYNSVDDRIQIYNYNGAYNLRFATTQVFRDTSAWYNIVVAIDTTQATNTNRMKVYVNGVQITDTIVTPTYPSENFDTYVNSAVLHKVGKGVSGNYFDGYIAEVNFIDGLQLGPDSFGEFKDSIWVPKDVSGLTFGQNGFHLDFSDSSYLGRDKSGAKTLVTADATLDGGNFSASEILDGFNGLLTTSCNRSGSGGIVDITPASAVTPVSHTMVNAGSAYSAPSRPNSVLLQGSNDGGSNWTTINDMTNGSGALKETTSSFSNTTSYAKLRLNISENHGGSDTRFAEYVVVASEDNGDGGNVFFASGPAATDVVPDSMTNNFATLNNVHPNAATGNFSEGNLRSYQDQSPYTDFYATFAVSSGKWYWEARAAGTATQQIWGFAREDALVTGNIGAAAGYTGYAYFRYGSFARERANGSDANASGTLSLVAGDIIGLALNLVDNEVKFYKNGTLEHTITGVQDGTYYPFICYQMNLNRLEQRVNFGQDSTFAGLESAGGNSDDNGIGDFAQSPISGHLAICSANLPEPSIISGEDYFNTVLYAGDGEANRTVAGVGFSPNWLWIKNRSNAFSHMLYDTIRGAGKYISADVNDLETDGNHMNSFDSDGFTVSVLTSNRTNQTDNTYVAWNWLAGTAVSGATTGAGTAKTYTGSVNTKSGFSIIKYVGNGTSGHTIPHNLTVDGVATTPTMIMVKRLDADGGWRVQHKDVASTHYLALDTNAAKADLATIFNDTAFNSTVFTVGSAGSINSNDAGSAYIAYCFTDIEGFSKAGMYIGNSSADGTYVNTGFKVSWLMVKDRDNTGSWYIWDDKRSAHNEMNDRLVADLEAIETADREVDFLSSGFKLRESNNAHNTSGREYIFLAFGSSPAKYSNAK